MTSKNDITMHDCFERVRPILEEYFDNWVISGHMAGTKTRVALGQSFTGWGDMGKIRHEIRNWQKESMEDTGKVPPCINKTSRETPK